ncbi:aspartic peptidase domain-containing protein [Suillus spraguei]|nr:aspartic peptidase domain-containing protein [Suillus spraguei]
MFSVSSLLVLLAFSITGSPVEVRNSFITLPMTRRSTFSNVTDILRHDEARVAAFMEYSTHGRRADVPLRYYLDMGYTVSVDIGWPPITCKNPYVSLTGVNTGVSAEVHYDFGTFQGILFRDALSFTELTVHKMLFGVTVTSQGIGIDGTLGIGPRVSSLDALQHENVPARTIPSVTDYLFGQDTIRQPVVGIFFKPIITNFVNDGELTFGGADPTKYTSAIGYTHITATPRSSLNWGIDQEIYYGNREIMHRTAGVVDCGTTFFTLPPRYQAATGGIVNAVNDLLQISAQQYNHLRALNFHIDLVCQFCQPSHPFGIGYDFIMGYVYLQRFYTVFDAHNSQIDAKQHTNLNIRTLLE